MAAPTRDRNLPANLKLEAPPPQYDQEKMRQAFRIIEQHWHLQNPAAGGSVCFDIICGEGSPEGVVTAVPDSLYVQTDFASTSHPYWVKISGSGNTGWRAWVGLRGSGTNSIRIGDNATASATNAQAYGDDSAATKQDAIAIGRTTANNKNAINIGLDNTITEDTSPFASSSPMNNVVIGTENALSDDIVEGFYGRIVGWNTYHDTLIGSTNEVHHTAFGDQIHVLGSDNIVKGDALFVGGFDNTLEQIGTNHGVLSGDCTYGVLIGNDSQAYADCFIAIGYSTTAFGIGAVAVGPHTTAGVDDRSEHCTAVGRFARALGDYSTALGAVCRTEFTASIAIGESAHATQAHEMGIGSSAHYIATVRFNQYVYGDDEIPDRTAQDVTFQGAIGTGTGTAGAFIFQIGTPTTTGTTPHAYATKGRINTNGFSFESSVAKPVATVTGDTTLTAAHHTVLVNDTNPHTITLPTAASAFANGAGRVYVVKQIGSGAVTLKGNGSENIDASNTKVFGAQYDTVRVQSDGTQWWII